MFLTSEQKKNANKIVRMETLEKKEDTAIDFTTSPKRIFIGSLPRRNIKESILKDFAKFGEIEKYQFPRNASGEMRKFCFINFKDPESAEQAVKEMNKSHYFGHVISVQLAAHQEKPNYHKEPTRLKRQDQPRRPKSSIYFNRDEPLARECLPPHHSSFSIESFYPSRLHFPGEYQTAYRRLPMYRRRPMHGLDAPRYSPPSALCHAQDEPRYSPPNEPRQATKFPLYSPLQIHPPSCSPPVIDLPPAAHRYSLEAPVSPASMHFPFPEYYLFSGSNVPISSSESPDYGPAITAKKISKNTTASKSIAELLGELMNKNPL